MSIHIQDLWQKIIRGFFALYFLTSFLIFAPYYNWKFAQTHGFIRWILFGEVIATTKAIVWPYYLVSENFGETFHVEKTKINQNDKEEQVLVFATMQDAEGATEEDFTIEELNKLEVWSTLLAVEKGSKIYATGGVPAKFTEIPKVEAMYVTVGGKKLAIIKMALYPPKGSGKSMILKMVRIIGFTDRGLETVLCSTSMISKVKGKTEVSRQPPEHHPAALFVALLPSQSF